MPETTPLIKAALNLRGGAGFDVYQLSPSHGNFKKLLREADKSRIKNQPRTVIVQRLILFNVIHANVYVGNI